MQCNCLSYSYSSQISMTAAVTLTRGLKNLMSSSNKIQQVFALSFGSNPYPVVQKLHKISMAVATFDNNNHKSLLKVVTTQRFSRP